MHFVYILKSKSDKWYIGYTSDLLKRVNQHKKLHPGYQLIYYERYLQKKTAVMRERQLKHYGSAWRALRDRLQA